MYLKDKILILEEVKNIIKTINMVFNNKVLKCIQKNN